MARPRNKVPGPASPHKGQMRLWWNGRWWTLGPADRPEVWQARERELRALWVADPNAVPRAADDYLVSELCADYLASADSPRDGLARDRAWLAVDLLAELYPDTPVAEFGPKQLRAWQAWLCGLKNARGECRFNVTTINYHVGTIRRIWKWGVGTERVPEERAAALAAVPRPRPGDARPPRVVEPADPAAVRAILPHLLPPVRAMVVLQLAAGARPGELCGMKAGDVLRGGTVHVPGAGRHDLDALGVWAYVPPKHKLTWRGKPRFLVFAGEAQEVLRPFLDRAPDAYCFSPAEAMREFRAGQSAAARAKPGGRRRGNCKPKAAAPRKVFADHYDPKAYYHAVRRACERAGVGHFSPYQLRHLAAAELKNLYDLDAVQALLGHHSKSTADHYGGLAFRKAAEVAKARRTG